MQNDNTKQLVKPSAKRLLKPNPRKGGSKLKRDNLFQLRVDDRVKFSAEVGARAQIKTVAAYVESCIEGNAKTIQINHLVRNPEYLGLSNDEPITLATLIKKIWHPDETVRFVRLAQLAPLLLSPDESKIWSVIEAAGYFINSEGKVNIKLIKALWSSLELADDPIDISPKELDNALKKTCPGASSDLITSIVKLIEEAHPHAYSDFCFDDEDGD